MKSKPTKEQLEKALRDLLKMVLDLDPFDARRAAVKRAAKLINYKEGI